MPNTDTVSLPATQTYSDGTVVHRDQPPLPSGGEPEHPMPMLTLTQAAPEGASTTDAPAPASLPAAPAQASSRSAPDTTARARGRARAGQTAAVMRTAAALLGALLAVMALTTAPTASAHPTRIATDPAVNAVLTTGPSQVSATFNELIQPTFAAMTVVGPDGNLWSTGQPRVQGAIISIDVMPLGPAGTYTVNYRVTSADGHVVSGSWPFQLTTAGTAPPGPPAAAPAASGGIPIWRFLAIGAVLVAGGAWWTLRRRRPRSG